MDLAAAELQPAKKLAPGQEPPIRLRDPIAVPRGQDAPKGKSGRPAPTYSVSMTNSPISAPILRWSRRLASSNMLK